jgi:diguanylate cyclase (GGDEF)-like protein/PAS domain S-box-containing protein
VQGDEAELLGLLFAHSPVPQFVSRADGSVVLANAAYTQLMGATAEAVIGSVPSDVTHPDDLVRLMRLGRQLLRREIDVAELEVRVTTAGGQERWCAVTCTMAPGSDGKPLFVSHLLDISARKEAEAELRQAEEDRNRLAAIAETTSDLIGVIDADGWVVYANAAARAAHGLAEHDAAALHATKLYTPESNERFFRDVLPELLAGRTWSGELAMYDGDGSVIQVWQSLAPHHGADGDLHNISAVGRDITAQKLFEAQLAHRATHDHLTGLPNRALLLEVLDRVVRHDLPADTKVAVLFVDLDRFKAVNDELGHDAGDDLLRAVAGRFSSVLRPSDVVARLGGDEFVVLCPDIERPEQGAEVAQRLIDALTAEPVELRGRLVPITASVGVTVAVAGPEQHPEALLREADAAMYRAKALGRDRYELFEDESPRAATGPHLAS